MSFPSTLSAGPENSFLDAPRAGLKRMSLISCTDGSDGYPTLLAFNAHMNRYLEGKKRAERTVISSADLGHIHHLLADPAALRAEPSASHRTWIKKTFFLKPTSSGALVCHKEKGHSTGRPIASKEAMYFILKEAHASEGHGGRDKTAKAVKLTHSYIRKGLICIFLETCPTCQARNEAVKKEKSSLASGQKASCSETTAESVASFGTGLTSPSSPMLFGRNWTRHAGAPLIHHDPMSVNSSAQAHLMIRSPTIPAELAYAPAAPVAASRTRYASYPACLPVHAPHRTSNPELCTPSYMSSALSASHVIVPHTACSFDDQLLANQQEYPSLSSIALPSQTFHPQNYGTDLSQSVPNYCSSEPPTQTFPVGESDMPLIAAASTEVYDILNAQHSENESFGMGHVVPLIVAQPQLPSSDIFRHPFLQEQLGYKETDIQAPIWSPISPMANMTSSEIQAQFQQMILLPYAQASATMVGSTSRNSCF